MKKYLYIIALFSVTAFSCDSTEAVDIECTGSTYNGHQLNRSPKGCYYININGNRTFVDSTFCNC
ncbi:hypothetical protein [Spirosoma knui]